MARTIKTSIAGPLILSPSDDPLTITTAGAIISTGTGIDGIDGATGTDWIITNRGTVSSAGGDGISLAANGVVTNSGSISGGESGVVISGSGVVTNTKAGSISGEFSEVEISGFGVVTNHGNIEGVFGGAVEING